MISNKALYKRCNTIPLSIRVTKSRLKMLGHILRSPENSPAQSALCFAVNCCSSELKTVKGRIGRPRTSLLKVIKNDLKSKNLAIDNYYDILKLRELAYDRKGWRTLFEL